MATDHEQVEDYESPWFMDPDERVKHAHRWPWNSGAHSVCACGVLAPWLRPTLFRPDIGPDVPGGGAI